MTDCICILSLLGILIRPRGIGEWVWALGGALLLIAFQLVDPKSAFDAVTGGADVYLFLAGMMLLSEAARREGVFDWLAARAAAAAKDSAFLLFALVYAVGVAVTVVLSNDATAIVLTPAVATAVKRANVPPMPCLLACAFVANAASFVLPISNPANLIMFAGHLPALGVWFHVFGWPSFGAIATTFAVLWWLSHDTLAARIASGANEASIGRGGTVALTGIALAAIALVATSALRGPIGAATFIAAVGVLGALSFVDRNVARAAVGAVPWSILILVASLFVLVAGLERTGNIEAIRSALATLPGRPAWPGIAAISIATAFGTNLTNNLPLGVVAAKVLSGGHVVETFRYAAVVGIDLGPNLSVSGSLATILWLAAVRREGVAMDALRFLRTGAIAMPAALAVATALLAIAR